MFLMVQIAYGKYCLSHSKVFKKYASFKNGRDFLEDEPREGVSLHKHNDENTEDTVFISTYRIF